jgi:hypothetical protein
LKKYPQEDLVTGSRNNEQMKQQAQEMVEQMRDIRRKIDELRINELARKKLREGGI